MPAGTPHSRLSPERGLRGASRRFTVRLRARSSLLDFITFFFSFSGRGRGWAGVGAAGRRVSLSHAQAAARGHGPPHLLQELPGEARCQLAAAGAGGVYPADNAETTQKQRRNNAEIRGGRGRARAALPREPAFGSCLRVGHLMAPSQTQTCVRPFTRGSMTRRRGLVSTGTSRTGTCRA